MCYKLTYVNLVQDDAFIRRFEPQNLLFPAFAGQSDALHSLVTEHILLPFLASANSAVIYRTVFFRIERHLDCEVFIIDGMRGQHMEFDGP